MKTIAIRVTAVVVLLMGIGALAAEDQATKLPPITRLEGLAPSQTVTTGWDKPLVLKSAEEAAKHFSKEEAAKLAKQVDFTRQIVLVFAWHGSGGDTLDYTLAESMPEQVNFKFQPGRTKDLREHVHIYALRSDVRWSAPAAAR